MRCLGGDQGARYPGVYEFTRRRGGSADNEVEEEEDEEGTGVAVTGDEQDAVATVLAGSGELRE